MSRWSRHYKMLNPGQSFPDISLFRFVNWCSLVYLRFNKSMKSNTIVAMYIKHPRPPFSDYFGFPLHGVLSCDLTTVGSILLWYPGCSGPSEFNKEMVQISCIARVRVWHRQSASSEYRKMSTQEETCDFFPRLVVKERNLSFESCLWRQSICTHRINLPPTLSFIFLSSHEICEMMDTFHMSFTAFNYHMNMRL